MRIDEMRNQSDFNNALGFIIRIDDAFKLCDGASFSLDSFSWFHGLLVLQRELSNYMTEKEDKQAEEYRRKIAPMISSAVASNSKGSRQISQEVYDVLHEFELFLRRVYKKSGLQGKESQSPYAALGASS